MSTSCYIGYKNRYIYCHWDGYPAGVGAILKHHYTDEKKIQKLINLGDISVLAKNIEPTSEHTFDNPQENVTVAYHRDNKEPWEDTKAKIIDDEFLTEEGMIEYAYLYDEYIKKWKCQDLLDENRKWVYL